MERCFAFIRPKYLSGSTVTYGDTELWEIMRDDSLVVDDVDIVGGENVNNEITAEIETPSFDFDQIGAAKILESADL